MSTLLETINASASPEVQMNENFEAVAPGGLFGVRRVTTAGLTFGYFGGRFWDRNASAYDTVANGTVVLPASEANVYIEAAPDGTVSQNTVGWSEGKTPLYIATTSGSAITALEDYRVLVNAFEAPLPQETQQDLELLNSPATIDWDMSKGMVGKVVLTADAELLAPTNMPTTGTATLVVTQDGGGGNVLTFGEATGAAMFKFPGGTPPTITATGGATDLLHFKIIDGGTLLLIAASQDLS